jgi:hypothetical protein
VAQSSRVGAIEIRCLPWCEIDVDGRRTGRTSPARINLPEGTHRLRLVNPALGVRKAIQVAVSADRSLRQIVDMEK